MGPTHATTCGTKKKSMCPRDSSKWLTCRLGPAAHCQVLLLIRILLGAFTVSATLACLLGAVSTEGATQKTGAQLATATIPQCLFYFEGEYTTGGLAAESLATSGAKATDEGGVSPLF